MRRCLAIAGTGGFIGFSQPAVCCDGRENSPAFSHEICGSHGICLAASMAEDEKTEVKFIRRAWSLSRRITAERGGVTGGPDIKPLSEKPRSARERCGIHPPPVGPEVQIPSL